MESIPTWVPVVALALRDEKQRLLLQQRGLGKHHGGLWEFPGGKVEPGENPRFALIREIGEELAITLDPENLTPAGFAEEGQGKAGAAIVLFLYTADRWHGQVHGCEEQQWGWFSMAEAGELPLAPMDRHLLHGLSA